MESIYEQLLKYVKKDEMKVYLKTLFAPILETIFNEMYPYIFISLTFVIISFLLILGIFILLLQNRKVNIFKKT